ncbi:MAG: hypothetical protein CBC13_04680 [Planctomycetia bacterium TMED53]|nr:MAG: hypothetical protein CBC13_04680 [Planctomycetia bacterium TMED53]
MMIEIRKLTALLAFVIVFTDLPVIPGGFSLTESISEAQDPPRRRRGRRGRPTPPPQPEPEQEEKEVVASKSDDKYVVVKGATIHTVTGGTHRNGTLICKNGKIYQISAGPVDAPEGAEIIEAEGHHVYPGLVAFRSSGLVGSGEAEKSQDPYDLDTTMGLAAGITATWNGSRVTKLVHGSLDDLTIRPKSFSSINYSFRNPRGRKELRQAFDRVQEHLRALERHAEEKKEDPEAKPPEDKWIKGIFAVVRSLLTGESKALVRARTMADIREYSALARKYGFEIVFEGAEEGWIDPGVLSRTGASAVISPRARVDANNDLNRESGSSIENAKMLHDAGVPLVIIPQSTGIALWGLAGRDLSHLPLEAAFAVRGGLPEQVAIEAITIEPARLLGVADRVGSLEVGKDADFIITDGDLLSYMTLVRWAIVNGKVQYDKEKEGILDHIRPDGDLDAPPPADHWPRRLGDPL